MDLGKGRVGNGFEELRLVMVPYREPLALFHLS